MGVELDRPKWRRTSVYPAANSGYHPPRQLPIGFGERADAAGSRSMKLTPSSVIAARARLAPATAGIALMLLATLLFTVMDSIAKGLTASYPLQQVIWARYFFQFALMLLLIPRLGGAGLLWTRRPAVQIARGLLLTISTGCMITAISMVPLADAYTITFIAPLLVTLLSIPLLKEPVGWRRLSAVAVGFVGVLIVFRPFAAPVDWAMLLPLITAACFALYQILTRKVSYDSRETAFMMLFYLAWVGTAVMSAIVPFHWQTVAPGDWAWMTGMGALGAAGHLILIRALTIAPASLLSPFIYSQIVWALGIGYLWFGDMPSVWMLIGCTVIVASGLYIFYREALLGKK
jgi:drug/metabolite transporter (DMT)-like permease